MFFGAHLFGCSGLWDFRVCDLHDFSWLTYKRHQLYWPHKSSRMLKDGKQTSCDCSKSYEIELCTSKGFDLLHPHHH